MNLGVNIDHVATVRQARYAQTPWAHNAEPCLVAAAEACVRGGAHGITLHLRADRRHVQDRDVERVRAEIPLKLNLEMGNTPEILAIALRIAPAEVCLVPENRKEISTEGGLDAAGLQRELAPTIRTLQSAGVRVSLFIDPEPAQVEAARTLGAEMVELHTGAFANVPAGEARIAELKRLQTAAVLAHAAGIQVNAGHGINYENIAQIRKVPHLVELNIGHSIVARAVMVGMESAVREMLEAMNCE